MNVHEGNLIGTGLRVALIVSRFNTLITQSLLDGAADACRRHGVADDEIDVFRCPGTFEMGPLARRAARSGRYDAVVTLGCVIRGDTPHFEYVATEVAKAVAQVAMEADCAVTFGVLTCDTMEQALDRAGLKSGNKGAEAVVAAIEQANTIREMTTAGEPDLTA
jgi:6,7-dimethyl-8-ribityllumazine synthase